jgi:hypothetical protein
MATDPAPGQPSAAPAPPAVSPVEGEVPSTPDERQMAMLAHLGGILPFLGFAIPLGLWAAKMGQSPFIEDQAKESLNLQINVLMLMILAALCCFIPYVGWIIPVGFAIANGVYCYMGAMEAKEGKAYRYPYNVRYIN